MEDIRIVIDKNGIEHIVIDKGNGEFTSMLKSTWDELEAAKENGTISQEYGKTLQSRPAAQGADR